MESYEDQRTYLTPDANHLRADLDHTLGFLPTIGFQRLDEPTTWATTSM
jgi:hypothetical protein